MSLSKNVRHCRRCISLSRQLAENSSRDVGGNGSTITGNILQKTKMSMPNQGKFLAVIKDFLNKSAYEKNIQLIINKDWIDFFQKLTYSQIVNIRRFSPILQLKSFSTNNDDNNKNNDSTRKAVVVNIEDEKSVNQEEKHLVKQKLSPESKLQKQEIKMTEVLPSISTEKDFKDQILAIPQVLAALVPKFRSQDKVKPFIIPKWKTNMYNNVSKHSILSRTKHVLNSIATAESNTSKWRRVEDLLVHIDQYPEARYHAIKEGGIAILLRMRQKTNDKQIHDSIREALTVLGHVDPLPNRGIRILTIDGGGIRGVMVVEMLKKLEQLTGKRIYELFDYICGVSTGAILSSVIATIKDNGEGGAKKKTLDEVSILYKELSTQIFTQSPLKGTSGLVWSHAYYDTTLWEEMLQDQLGDKELIKTSREPMTPKFSTVSAVVNLERVSAFVFRNYTLPHGVESQYMGSYKYKLWEAVRASAAAPSYFEEFRKGDYLHQDGGILVNNPCAVAIHEAKQLWPNNPIQCVVSFGTGRTPCLTNPCNEEATEEKGIAASSWKEKFYKILDSATDTEAVHIMLNDLLPDHAYYRFNPYLSEMLTMVEIRPDKIEQLEQDVAMYIRRNEEKFQQAAEALLQKKSMNQQIQDWVRMKKKMFTT
ncbi:calcium-independent phospholipase A2-gamma-like isoform X1 [Leptopilina boulardi]|uniref:calcium-independent phospholipase A2-gamma-like isoform X1 n=2 Tax=Leptopilina boulardi TaxID=63433 RepID=UPI0021F54273|nr:calcium-independent phospholipase A2-gamma-like isoform X1 [Leptopilina boulardi]